jgi:hypothetical protein
MDALYRLSYIGNEASFIAWPSYPILPDSSTVIEEECNERD